MPCGFARQREMGWLFELLARAWPFAGGSLSPGCFRGFSGRSNFSGCFTSRVGAMLQGLEGNSIYLVSACLRVRCGFEDVS